MSGDKNPEMVGCNASIMKNAWEIRERDHGQKMQQEQERKEKSALSSINKDWENRLAARLGKGTKVERKIPPVENQPDLNNIWKDKQPLVPPTLPRGQGSGVVSKPGGQMRGLSTSALKDKDKKGQDKYLNKLKLLMSITQTQPSMMVWGKSWKHNKSLPSPDEDAAAPVDWGKCWMSANHQPYSESGKPWLNGPNIMDPKSLHLWKKPEYRVVESQELDLILPTVEWQMSWRKSGKNNKKGDTSSVNEESVHKSGFFTWLVETQHHNEALCSSEWNDSWRSTKPASQQDNFTIPNSSQMNESFAKKPEEDRERSSKWEECWKFVSHLGSKNIRLPQNQNAHIPEWADSWRAATVVSNNRKNSDPSLKQDHCDSYDDYGQQEESHLQKVILLSHEKKYRDLYLQLCNECMSSSEWSKSWQVTKNNSKPCEEIEKLLKMVKNAKGHDAPLEKTNPCNEQLKHDVIYPKREFTKKHLFHDKHLKNVLSDSEWRDSWKTLKHRMRMERRRLRPDPLRPFRESEREEDTKPTLSVWKASWRVTCQPLNQEPELWQQGWLTFPQIRVNRARDHNHFAPVEIPKNGPTGDRNWGESWRFRRNRMQPSLERSSMTCRLNDSLTHISDRFVGRARSVSDWQEAWMVSETQFHHDKPSLTQWREAWKCSFFNKEQWSQLSRENMVGTFMEIQPQRETISLQRAKHEMSRSFDIQMFRERYPEKEWSASWRAGSHFNHQPSYYGSSGKPGKSVSSNTQQHHVSDNGHGSQWGMSFRIANPMPHVKKPWVECSPNQYHYRVMWSRGKNIQNNIITNFSITPQTFMLWVKSHQFLQGAGTQTSDKTKSKEPADHWVIVTNTTKIREHLFSKIEQEKQSEKKWPGCHLWCKIQPRPKKGLASVPKLKMEDEDKEFWEKWAESWRFKTGSLKKQMSMRSPAGWEESWKFLLPMCQPMNGPKAK